MAYLDQGLKNVYCMVMSDTNGQRYRVVMSPDGTVITSEKTALATGVYLVDSETPENDINIVNSINSLYQKKVKYNTNLTVGTWIMDMLEAAQVSEFYPIIHIPKMTKALASNLSAVKEAMVIVENDNDYEFICFGYRRVIAESIIMATQKNPLFIFPDRFFTGACFETRFKTNLFMTIFEPHSIVVTNDTTGLDQISIIMCLDWQEHTNYLENSLLE